MQKATKEFIEDLIHVEDQWKIHCQICYECKIGEIYINKVNAITELIREIYTAVAVEEPEINYLNIFSRDIQQSAELLIYMREPNNGFIQGNEKRIREELTRTASGVHNFYSKLQFNFSFFKKLGFFNSNIVAIGANGSGKSSLSSKLNIYLENNGVVVSAQRILLVPNFDSVNNPQTTFNALRQIQSLDKTNKHADQIHYLQSEFGTVLKHLLSENISLGNEYRRNAIENVKKGEKLSEPPISNLDKTIDIWNSLVEHRVINCKDGMNISAKPIGGESYPAVQMSDGEKVMLFLIAQILQAPENGFIIVDEPEMYLHKTILKRLWDIMERERQDCIFIYLTHDLDFAASRTTAKKIWIKSFNYPDDWTIEDIPENEIPEPLLLELLGSRRNILFCEGEKGSIDEKIFNILFPKYTITPVGSCFNVISHTKAFNKLSSLSTRAFGLIDSDHHQDERLVALNNENIYSFTVSEIENLLLDEDFLKLLSTKSLSDAEAVVSIKEDIILELGKQKILQTSNFVSSRVDYYFKDSNLKKGNDLENLENNYKIFTDEVDIPSFFNKRMVEIEEIISENDYSRTLAVFNNKGLKRIANKHFKISDFTERAIRLLQFDIEAQKILLKYFPNNIVET